MALKTRDYYLKFRCQKLKRGRTISASLLWILFLYQPGTESTYFRPYYQNFHYKKAIRKIFQPNAKNTFFFLFYQMAKLPRKLFLNEQFNRYINNFGAKLMPNIFGFL